VVQFATSFQFMTQQQFLAYYRTAFNVTNVRQVDDVRLARVNAETRALAGANISQHSF
jgi:hypothetical protein